MQSIVILSHPHITDGPNSTDIMAAVAEYYEEAQQVEQQEDEEVSSVGLSSYHRRSLSCGAIPPRNTCRTKLVCFIIVIVDALAGLWGCLTLISMRCLNGLKHSRSRSHESD